MSFLIGLLLLGLSAVILILVAIETHIRKRALLSRLTSRRIRLLGEPAASLSLNADAGFIIARDSAARTSPKTSARSALDTLTRQEV